jgi:hypothetical protein
MYQLSQLKEIKSVSIDASWCLAFTCGPGIIRRDDVTPSQSTAAPLSEYSDCSIYIYIYIYLDIYISIYIYIYTYIYIYISIPGESEGGTLN